MKMMTGCGGSNKGGMATGRTNPFFSFSCWLMSDREKEDIGSEQREGRPAGRLSWRMGAGLSMWIDEGTPTNRRGGDWQRFWLEQLRQVTKIRDR